MVDFADVHAAIGDALRRHFPDAEPCTEWNIDGYRVQVQDEPDEWKGTMPPTHLIVLPDEKKAGITTHIWDPRDPDLLRHHEAALKQVGFKVMVGCIQWNRKADYPVDAVEAVFAGAAASDS